MLGENWKDNLSWAILSVCVVGSMFECYLEGNDKWKHAMPNMTRGKEEWGVIPWTSLDYYRTTCQGLPSTYGHAACLPICRIRSQLHRILSHTSIFRRSLFLLCNFCLLSAHCTLFLDEFTYACDYKNKLTSLQLHWKFSGNKNGI